MEFLDKRPESFDLVLLKAEIPSDIKAKNPVIDEVLGILRGTEYLTGGEEDLLNIRLVLEEAIVNSIRHGNKYDVRKSVKVEVGEIGDHWGVVIEDEGDGFAPEDLPDPNDPAAIFNESGRGVYLMNYFMDKVIYFNNGSGVYFEKSKFTATIDNDTECQS